MAEGELQRERKRACARAPALCRRRCRASKRCSTPQAPPPPPIRRCADATQDVRRFDETQKLSTSLLPIKFDDAASPVPSLHDRQGAEREGGRGRRSGAFLRINFLWPGSARANPSFGLLLRTPVALRRRALRAQDRPGLALYALAATAAAAA